MRLPFYIARRYLFAKRSTNAIHIITGIAVFGISIGTAALILVLSVFNGFEDLLAGLFGHFNPDIKITASKGKTFSIDDSTLQKLRSVPGVAVVGASMEEIAFFEYQGSQDFGVLKGVDENFARINGIDSTVLEGKYLLAQDDLNYAVLGAGMRNKLSVNVENPLAVITVYMPDQKAGALDKPFKSRTVYPAGAFAIQQDYDNQYILTNIHFVRELLEADSTRVSAVEVRLQPRTPYAGIKKQIAEMLGPGYVVKDEYEQNEAFFKVMRLEKWMGFAITALMLILMAFNTIGALWMIVLDKQKDISVLKSMGADDETVRRIFLLEGLLLTLLGMAIGILIAVGLYFAQKEYGLIRIPEGFLVDSYPIAMRALDFIPVTAIVVCIGLAAAILPARRAVRVPAYLREE